MPEPQPPYLAGQSLSGEPEDATVGVPATQTPVETPAEAAVVTTGGTVAKAGLWAAASRALPQVYSLAISVVAARALGPDGMGRQSLIAFAAIFGTAAATLGVPTALMRFVGERVGAHDTATLRPLVRVVWKVEAVAAIAGGLVLIGIGLNGGEPRLAWVLAGFTCALGVLQKVPTAALIGLQRWRDASAVTMVMGGIAMAATIAVLAAGGGVTAMIAVGTGSTFVILIWTTLRMRDRLSALTQQSQRDPQLHRRVWRYAAIASLGVPVTLIVWFRSEFFFLAHYSSDKQIALYSIAFSAYTAVVILPQSLANAIAPAFATLYGAGEAGRIRQGFGRAMRLLLTATLPLTAATMALGPETLRVVYGDVYGGTGTPLLILLGVLPLVPLLQVSMSLLVGLARQWLPLAFGAIAAAVNISLDIALIPQHAAVGAATANAISQVVASVSIIAYAVHIAGGIEWHASTLARAALVALGSGLVAAAVVTEVHDWTGIVLGIIAWAVVYFIGARVLRVVSESDAQWLDGILGPRIRRVARFMLGRARIPVQNRGEGGA
jgi:O-antigen/teichoic acid export membrane protein